MLNLGISFLFSWWSGLIRWMVPRSILKVGVSLVFVFEAVGLVRDVECARRILHVLYDKPGLGFVSGP